MISRLKARLQLLNGSNAGILYFPPVFNVSLRFLKFHVTRKSSSSVTVFATKQLKVMLLKAFAEITEGPERSMWIPRPTKGENNFLICWMLRERVLREEFFYSSLIRKL